VATWCHNIARDLPIQVRDPNAEVTLVYVDDVVKSFISRVERVERGESPTCSTRSTLQKEILSVTPAYTKTLGEIVGLIQSFHDEPKTLMVPDQKDGFTKKLYATYLSSLPEDQFSYPLTMHCDNRGSFTEALHSEERGQVSVNISHPGIVKGQHWHHTKHEKFLVVSGHGEINFRMADVPNAKIITYKVSGEKLEVVRIPPGYTHNIVNVGDTDMVTLMWANEVFDPANPDTFRLDI
jgi:UDP-2-acetamido-2,6-beta-L-arabino-hexul-4-ose reductase